MNKNELIEKAKKLLGDMQINAIGEDVQIITFLEDIKDGKIENLELNILEKTIYNIENYFYTKTKMQIIKSDYEYLKKLAEILRNQKVRIEDGVVWGHPTFKIILNKENTEDIFYFMTREGVENFLEANSTSTPYLKVSEEKNLKKSDNRKVNIFEVSTNKNLEFEKIIEIIKRNF